MRSTVPGIAVAVVAAAFLAPRFSRADLYLNCGGPDVADATGRVWTNDEQFLAPGGPSSQTAEFQGEVDRSGLRDPAPPPEVFASERSADGELRYLIPAERGFYQVTLYASENCRACVRPSLGGTGCADCARLFDIGVEGSWVEGFLPADAASPPSADGLGRTFVAVELPFTVYVADGMLEIRVRDLGPGNPPGDAFLNAVAVRLISPGERAPLFVRGDANADGKVDISDAICSLAYLFGGAGEPCAKSVEACPDASDSNDDGALDISDAITTLGHLFLGQEPPPEPYPDCGGDRSEDALSGCAYPQCASEALESPYFVGCGADREIYRNLGNAAVTIAVEAHDGCPSLRSEIACGGETRTIEDGGTLRAQFQVPPGGKVTLRCRGSGEGECSYRVLLSGQWDETVTLSGDGSAAIDRTTTISDAFLVRVYEEYRRACLVADPNNQAQQSMQTEAADRFVALFGVTPPALRGGFRSSGGVIGLSQQGEIPALATYVEAEGVWRLPVGPRDEQTLDFNLGRTLQSMLFQSMYLESLAGEQVLNLRNVTRIVLPQGALLRNASALDGLSWEVDFGGGNRMAASVLVEEQAVVLIEESFVTENPPDRLLEGGGLQVLDAFSRYGRFAIEYLAPRPPERRLVPEEPGSGEGAGGGCTINVLAGYLSCLWDWNPSYTFDKTFSGDGYSVRVKADASALFEARIGWDFNWSWKEGIYLDWFEAWIRANPSLFALLEAHAAASYTRQWSALLTSSLNMTFWFNFGVPVWIRLRLEPYATAKVGFSAHFDGSYSASFKSQNRLGVRWDDGWSWINERSNNASYDNFSVDTSAAAYLSVGSYYHDFKQPGVELKAYVYDIAGPFVRGNPYLYGDIHIYPDHGDWALKGGFTAWGGVQVAGWLRDLLGLGSYGSWDHKFYSWETQIASGSWEIDIVPPTNPTQVSSPSHNPGTWSKDNTVEILWSGASDSGSGIAGYSVVWDRASGTVPDSTVDTTAETATSSPLSDGNWWFHIRAVDKAGNAAEGAVHLGPFRIDKTPPAKPILASPADGEVLGDSTPLLDWSDALDLSGVTYRLRVWYGDEIPEELAGRGEGKAAGSVVVISKDGLTESRYQITSREALPDRVYSWRVYAVDGASNMTPSDIWSFTVDAQP